MANRLKFFIIFLLLSLVTFGIYPFYFTVTRLKEQNDLLAEIRDELKARPKTPPSI